MKELIIYKERQFIDKYRCIDRIKKLVSVRSFQPAGVGLLYCYIDRYNLKTLDIDFIVDRIPLEYENKYILFRYSQEKKMYFYCERGQHWAGNEYGYMSRAAGLGGLLAGGKKNTPHKIYHLSHFKNTIQQC